MKSQVTDEIKKLSQIRKRLGWSQQKLATELGIGISTLARWELGRSNPGNLASEKIRQFLRKHEVE